MPLRDDFVIAKFNSANLGDTGSVRPAAGGFDVDDNIILLRIEPEIDAGDLGFYAGVTKLLQARELVAANDIPFRLYLNKGDGIILLCHKVGETVPHRLVVLTHEAEDCGDSARAGAEQRPQRVHVDAIP